MKVCFVGLGSIGTRHLHNLTSLLKKRGEAFEIDALRSSSRPLSAEDAALIHCEYTDSEKLPSDYDIAMICTPTNLHYESILKMSKHAKHLFVEKPVFDRADLDLSQVAIQGICYIACPLRYTSVIQYLKANLPKVRAARVLCSTYLPAWRPGIDYRKTYSAHKKLGGGVSIDLIHEWDYIQYLFGPPLEVVNMKGQFSALELESDDLSLYLGRYSDKLISLHLDYFGAVERREIELYTDDEVIVGDLRHSCIRYLKAGTTIELPELRDDFQTRELEHFLEIIDGTTENDNDIITAMRTLKTAEGMNVCKLQGE